MASGPPRTSLEGDAPREGEAVDPRVPGTVLYPVYTESPYVFTEGKVLLADRAYFAPIGTAAPTDKVLGQTPTTPTGWKDLGSIDQSLVTFEKDEATTTQVTTGLYEVLRAEIATKDGDARAKFTLVEYEPKIWALLTGETVHTVGTEGEAIWIGGKPILQYALLLVGQNPVTYAEFHHYNPKVGITYQITEVDRFKGIAITCRFYKYVPAGDATLTARDFEIIYFK